MGSSSNISSATAKTSNLAASLLSSISSSFSSGQLAADGLFADILSQNQPPPAPPPQNNNSQGTQTSSPQTQPSSAQDAETNNSQNNSANSGAPVANQPVVSRKGPEAGKALHHHDAKQAGDKSKSSDTGNQSAGNGAVTVQTNVSPDTSANTNSNTNADSTSAAVTAAASTAQNEVADNDPANNNSDTNSDPANPPVLSADLKAASAAPVPSTPVAPQTTDPSPAANDNANSGDPSSNGDMNATPLMLMLMQLERLTASAHLADPVSLNANALTAKAPDAAASAAGTDDTKGQVDLKTLLAAVAKSDSANSLGGDTAGQTGGTDASGDSQNTASANTAPAAPNTQQPVNSSQTQQAPADKWMNANFANLFNLASTDQNNNAVPLALNSLINPGVTTPGGGDGASLDDGGQGQSETGSHDLAANAPLNNNLPQATGPTQAANPYDFASQLSAMRATKGGATGLPTPVEQVMLQLSRGLSKDGPTQMTIQLRPAELGRIDVKLNVTSDGKVQGTVTADNPATLNLLLKDVKGLERALQEAGLRADSGGLQFNLRGDGQAGGSFNQTANNSSGFSGGASSGASASLPVFADQTETYYLTPGGVNMRV